MDCILEAKIKKRIRNLLTEDRYRHTINVYRIAVGIAKNLKCCESDIKKVSIAALLHDVAKCFSNKKSLGIIKKHRNLFDDFEMGIPKIWHAKISAIIANGKFNIKDKFILNAIARHTTGSENMSLIDKIIYIADIIDIDKNIKGIEKVKKALKKSIDSAMLEAMKLKMFYLIGKGAKIYTDTIKAWNLYLNR